MSARGAGGRRVTRIEVALAVPAGSVLAAGQREFLRAATCHLALAAERRDRRANLLEFIRVMARSASWLSVEDDPRATARPGRDRVCQLAGFSAATFKRCRAWWESHGYVAVVRQGRTEEARKMTRRRDVEPYDGNDAAVYALCVPRRAAAPAKTEPPKGSPINEVDPHARGDVVETPDSQSPGQGKTALRAGSPPATRTPARFPVPVDLARHRVLEKLSDKAVTALWRPFRDRGWSASDWLWAINWRPDNTPHRKDLASVRRPAGWARWRLACWLDENGVPVLSRSQRAAVRRQADRAERDANRYTHHAGADPSPEYLAARRADHRMTSRKGK